MQFFKITDNMTLSDLSNKVGSVNIDSILNLNSLGRTPDIGSAYKTLLNKILNENKDETVGYHKKQTILNTFVSDSDVFEKVSLFSDDEWKIMVSVGTIPGYLRIPDSITLPDSVDILGGRDNPVSRDIYIKAIGYLKSNTDIDPVIFNEYSTIRNAQILSKSGSNSTYNSNPIQWFKLPWGQITLFSSLSNTSIDFPVYPKGFDDGVSANYDTMPEMLYQYEPWQIYKSSGPRTNTYDFDLHRDMWTGDHRDGKCNELIRFCEANCYPEYRGASVQTSTVSLYIAGKKHITGIMTGVKVSWDDDSPIGLDGFYLHLTLSITITEVADAPLNYETVQKKGLIE